MLGGGSAPNRSPCYDANFVCAHLCYSTAYHGSGRFTRGHSHASFYERRSCGVPPRLGTQQGQELAPHLCKRVVCNRGGGWGLDAPGDQLFLGLVGAPAEAILPGQRKVGVPQSLRSATPATTPIVPHRIETSRSATCTAKWLNLGSLLDQFLSLLGEPRRFTQRALFL